MLLPVFPNPVSQELVVFYALPEASYVEVRIVDEYMRTRRALVDAWQEAGFHSLLWDLRDDNGNSVSPGYYRCILEADGFSAYQNIKVE